MHTFAIGKDRFAALLEHGEAVDISLEKLLNIGEADLRRNLERLNEVAATMDGDKSTAEVMAAIAADHPASDSLISDTRDMLEEIRQFLIDNDIVSVPSEVRCVTVPTPSFMRWASRGVGFSWPLRGEGDRDLLLRYAGGGALE